MKKKAKIFGYDYKGLATEIKKFRKEGKSIIMCSGTFDLFHVGHMRLLEEAKSKGDILIVVVKSDKAASLKKEDPPVLDENIRMETIVNCISVDYVAMVDYDSHRAVSLEFSNVASFQWLNMFEPLMKIVKPDIFVHEDNTKLADARRVLFEEYNVTGIIHPRTEGISTTHIIDVIKTRLLKNLQS